MPRPGDAKHSPSFGIADIVNLKSDEMYVSTTLKKHTFENDMLGLRLFKLTHSETCAFQKMSKCSSMQTQGRRKYFYIRVGHRNYVF